MDRFSSLQMAGGLDTPNEFTEVDAKPPANPPKSSHPYDYLDDYEPPVAVLKVIGVGGAGCHAVECMIREGVTGAEFICIDSDAQALKNSSVGTKIQIHPSSGTEDELSASSETELAGIIDALRGAHLVFIIVGMGGVAGTRMANMVAKAAKDVGILTVAFVTKPFKLERNRAHIAELGIKGLERHVDSLFVIPNDKLGDDVGEEVNMPEAFRYSDTVLTMAVGNIVDVIIKQGIVCLDYADVKTVLSPNKTINGMMGFATATGPGRARAAAEQALRCSLLEGANLSESYGILVIVTAAYSLKLNEVYEVIETVKKLVAQDDVVFIVGTIVDESMDDRLGVTLFATGIGK